MSSKQDAHVDYARLFSHSLRHIVVNWVTLRPLFRRIFSLKIVLITFIVFAFVDFVEKFFYLVADTSLLQTLDQETDGVFYKAYGFIYAFLYIPLYFLLLRYLLLVQIKNSSEELKKLKKQGVLTDSEFMIKNLEIELELALEQIKSLKEKGVLTRVEVEDFVKLTNRRYSELCQYQKLRQARNDKIITDEEFQQKCKIISSETESVDLGKVLTAIFPEDTKKDGGPEKT